MELGGVEAVNADQCMYGLLTCDKNGKVMPARKRTKLTTNCAEIPACGCSEAKSKACAKISQRTVQGHVCWPSPSGSTRFCSGSEQQGSATLLKTRDQMDDLTGEVLEPIPYIHNMKVWTVMKRDEAHKR